jgi:hypothetical protein
MDVRPLRIPIRALLVAVLLSAAVAGCGGEPVARVRVLQVDPQAFAVGTTPAVGRVRASLTDAAAPAPPPPVQSRGSARSPSVLRTTARSSAACNSRNPARTG